MCTVHRSIICAAWTGGCLLLCLGAVLVSSGQLTRWRQHQVTVCGGSSQDLANTLARAATTVPSGTAVTACVPFSYLDGGSSLGETVACVSSSSGTILPPLMRLPYAPAAAGGPATVQAHVLFHYTDSGGEALACIASQSGVLLPPILSLSAALTTVTSPLQWPYVSNGAAPASWP